MRMPPRKLKHQQRHQLSGDVKELQYVSVESNDLRCSFFHSCDWKNLAALLKESRKLNVVV